MDDDKKSETPAGLAVASAKPLAVQVVDAIIDGAAAIAKSVVVDTAERMGRSAAKAKPGRVAVSLVKKAKKVAPKRGKKAAPKKSPAKEASAKKASPKRTAAKKTAKKSERKTSKK